MVLRVVDPQGTELDDYIEAYESVRTRQGQVELADFLPPRDHPLYLPVLLELVRVDLDYGWRRGQPRPLEEYQGRFPELFQDSQCRAAIAYEEYRLRRQLGDRPSASDYQQRWGVSVERWPSGPSETTDELPPHADLPAVGTEFLDFHLLVELGRGAFGRVYLVRQKGLAGRHVVLKISTNITLETRVLAQLQHTNIVPVYSVHQAGPLHALCMPYLGSGTLADVIQAMRARQVLPLSGKGLVDTAQACKSTTRQEIVSQGLRIEHREAGGGEDVPDLPPVAWQQLEHLTYVQAVLWLASRLADGLAHAHERGILHRDLKPANILLTDDGQPMLLDFNLSEDVKRRSRATAAFIGGTLPYMAPEHLRAFQQAAATVDARSDVYSLGVILYELLTGRDPFPTQTGPIESVLAQMIQDRSGTPPQLRRWNKAISPAVESIVRHCLEPDPGRRYQSARQLQEDLQCQMESQPLRHAPEPSLRERTGKWVRRHPRLSLASVGMLALLLITGLTLLLVIRNTDMLHWEAVASFQQFNDELEQARLLLATSRPSERDRLDEGLALAHKALDRYQIRANPIWWQAPAVRRLSPDDQGRLREETGDFLLMLASIAAMQAQTGEPPRRTERLRAALDLNRLAESCYPDERAPALLWRRRDTLTRLLDPSTKSANVAVHVPAKGPQTTKDLSLGAQELMDEGRFTDALPRWQQASRLDPRDLWTWAGLAVCYENLARYTDAAACYSTCIALAPRLPWLYLIRGVTYLHSKNYSEARADFDQFLAQRPGVPEGHLHRALAWEGLKQNALALQDCTKAIDLGCTQTRIYFIRALLRERAGDRKGAEQDRQIGLQLEPADEFSCVVRGLAKLGADPKAALADFDRALQFNPRSLDGLQNKASVLSEQLGQPHESVKVLNRAVELYPEFVPARAGRGVLLARLGKRPEARQDAEECLRLDYQPATLYQVAGIYALTSKQRPDDREEALFLLASALRKGYGWDLIAIDSDLDPIRNLPEFRRLSARARAPARSS
jgi:serine/threonine protein kinase/Tfp pilus assembly protein PilF